MNRAKTYLRKDTRRGRAVQRYGNIAAAPVLSGCIIATRGYGSREGQVLTNHAYHYKRIGLEAGPLSQWHSISLC